MTDFVIETHQLCKSFRDQPALRGLDLQVSAGSIFGFLGRNGAGKTTTIKTLLGLLRADSGSAHVFGVPVTDADSAAGVRSRIGFVTEDKELYPYMTVEQIIRFTRPFFPNWRRDLEQRYLEMFELPKARKIPDLSKGMRSKLMLLLAIARGAELLILDEPTDGLDPAARIGFHHRFIGDHDFLFFASTFRSRVDRRPCRNCRSGQDGGVGVPGRHEGTVPAGSRGP
jgi:ABC-2 type transport system ATP-binding protein